MHGYNLIYITYNGYNAIHLYQNIGIGSLTF